MKFKRKTNKYTILVGLLTLPSCGINSFSPFSDQNSASSKGLEIQENNNDNSLYSSSGTITISYPVNKLLAEKASSAPINVDDYNSELAANAEKNIASSNTKTLENGKYAPVLGFIPLHASFQPADNEVWVEVDREKSKVNIYKGKDKLKEFAAEGKISLTPGQYPIQHKQKSPLWYAPDEYFEKRQLRVPPRGDHFRYRRGALGQYALYPTMDFIIHCGPLMSDEIGGLRVNPNDMSELFGLVNIGSSIVIK